MRWIKCCVAAVAISWASFQAINAMAKQHIIAENDPLFHEVTQIATRWKEAVLKKDVDVLASYALPEARKKILVDLRNTDSDLYRLFYKGNKSISETLREFKRLKIVLVAEQWLEDFGHGTTVYFFDEDRIKPRFPLSSDEARELSDRGEIVSMFFFKKEERWFTSYEFGDNSEEGPSD